MYTEKELMEKASNLSFKNRDMIRKSSKCGCYSCCQIYDAEYVWEYVDAGMTALCPMCYIDSVLPDACGIDLDEKLLERLKEKWFGDN